MKQMDLALFNYQSAMGVFPPTFTAQGRAGKCTQNWGRTWSNSIMPYLEQGNKYNALNFLSPAGFPPKSFRTRTRPPFSPGGRGCPGGADEGGATARRGIQIPRRPRDAKAVAPSSGLRPPSPTRVLRRKHADAVRGWSSPLAGEDRRRRRQMRGTRSTGAAGIRRPAHAGRCEIRRPSRSSPPHPALRATFPREGGRPFITLIPSVFDAAPRGEKDARHHLSHVFDEASLMRRAAALDNAPERHM